MSVKTYYAINYVFIKAPVVIDGQIHPLALSWMEGQIGAMPLFATQEEALKHADEEHIIAYEIEEEADD